MFNSQKNRSNKKSLSYQLLFYFDWVLFFFLIACKIYSKSVLALHSVLCLFFCIYYFPFYFSMFQAFHTMEKTLFLMLDNSQLLFLFVTVCHECFSGLVHKLLVVLFISQVDPVGCSPTKRWTVTESFFVSQLFNLGKSFLFFLFFCQFNLPYVILMKSDTKL